MSLDTLDDASPEPPFRVRLLDRAAADDGDAERVDPVAEEPEQCGQERQRREHGDDPDEDGARCEALHDRAGDEQHPEHGDHERRAAEEDGAARGRPRSRDRVELVAGMTTLFAVARDDEERVVDAECEAHAGEHVHDEDRQPELLRQERRQAQRHDDRDERHQQRHDSCHHGPENEDEDDQSGREAELELARLEVVLRELVEVVVERVGTGDRDGEARVGVSAIDDRHHLADVAVVGDVDRDHRRPPVARDERRIAR
jgi:hypothetical protein